MKIMVKLLGLKTFLITLLVTMILIFFLNNVVINYDIDFV